MKKVSTSLTRRIEEINELVRRANELETIPMTYAGGTFPYYVDIKPIEIKNQFVYIESANETRYDFISKERFNVNDDDFWSDKGIEALKYNLKHIKKALTNALNNQ